MKEIVERRISIRTRFTMCAALCAALLALIQVGCSSSGQQVEAPRPPGAVSTAQVTTPAEVLSLELSDQGEAASLRLTADRQLVWTNYRDNVGNLIIELPNSILSDAIADMAPSSGLVSGVTIEQLDDADRPLIRLVVQTREESEHALTTDGRVLELQLTPVGYVPVAEEPPVVLAYEPLPEEETLELAEDDTPEAPQGVGTPDAPLSGPPPSGVRASRLLDVEVLDRGDKTAIRVAGDGEFSYTTFRLENPERFVIDLAGVINTSSSSNLVVGSAAVEQIRIGQFKPSPDPVSRVVFDLQEFVAPVIERGADGLIVRFGAGIPTLAEEMSAFPEQTMAQDEAVDAHGQQVAMQDETVVTSEVAEPMATAEPEVVEVVTAEVVEESGGPAMPEPIAPPAVEEVVETAPEPAAAVPNWSPPAMEEEILEPEVQMAEVPPAAEAMPETAAPSSTIPVFEPPPVREPVIAQGAPPQSTLPSMPTSDVQLFEAQQVQLQQQQEEKTEPAFPQFEALVVNRREREYVGNPISMSLKNADLVETLRSFAKFSDLNFVIQPGVSGSVTVELTLVPWDQALEQVLKINNLGMDIDGTIVRIAPLAQLRAEAEEERQLAASRQQSIPLRTVLKSVSYATASEVAALLRNRTGSILSSRGTVQVDRRTNTLIIRELPGNIDTVLAVIENLDTPEPQVTIEARIIEATKQFSRSLGISWGFQGVASQEFGNTTGLQFPNNIDADGGVELLTGGANGFLDLSLGNVLDTFRLNTTIQAAENEGLVNVISAPRITTLNNESASIQSGLQIPIQTVSNRTVSVQFVNATLQLQVTPHVTAEGTIMMDINVSKKEPQLAFAIVGATNAPIATKEAQTKVVVRDGGTAVIGGIYEVTSNQNQDRVPGLANIPIIGHLFKNRSRDDSNDELMIFITPRIVQM